MYPTMWGCDSLLRMLLNEVGAGRRSANMLWDAVGSLRPPFPTRASHEWLS